MALFRRSLRGEQRRTTQPPGGLVVRTCLLMDASCNHASRKHAVWRTLYVNEPPDDPFVRGLPAITLFVRRLSTVPSCEAVCAKAPGDLYMRNLSARMAAG